MEEGSKHRSTLIHFLHRLHIRWWWWWSWPSTSSYLTNPSLKSHSKTRPFFTNFSRFLYTVVILPIFPSCWWISLALKGPCSLFKRRRIATLRSVAFKPHARNVLIYVVITSPLVGVFWLKNTGQPTMCAPWQGQLRPFSSFGVCSYSHPSVNGFFEYLAISKWSMYLAA